MADGDGVGQQQSDLAMEGIGRQTKVALLGSEGWSKETDFVVQKHLTGLAGQRRSFQLCP